MKKIFISYSHEDVKRVKQFAFQLSLRGFDIWMDEKNIDFGGTYTTAILNGIHESDYYLIFISKSSLESNWVSAEIDFALREKIERKKLVVVPVKLDDVDMPVPLSNLDYVDARFSIVKAADELSEKCGNDKGFMTGDNGTLALTSISFEITEKTPVEIGPYNEGITTSDLKESRNQLLRTLRKKANGILMNFVSTSDFDFQSDLPKFKNGLYEERVEKKPGSTSGSVCEQIQVEALVFNPDERRVKRLLDERLKVLSVNAVTFGFSLAVKDGDSILEAGKRCLDKIQDQYIILSYDNIEGARVEISDDFYLSFMPFENVIKVKLSTKYDWQFEKKMKDFSIIEFVEKLVSECL